MLAFVGCPWGFDGDDPLFVEGIVTIAAPRTILRLLNEAAFHGILVDVLECVDKFFVVADVAVVIAFLPKGTWRLVPRVRARLLGANVGSQAFRERQLQEVDCIGQCALLRLAQKQVDVFRHDNISVHPQPETSPHSLQTAWEEVVGSGVVEEWLPPVTTEGDEVGFSGFLETIQASRHEERVQVEIG